MNRVDVFLSDSGNIKIGLFDAKTQNKRLFSGAEVIKILRELAKEKLLDYKEFEDRNIVYMKYDDFILSIHNFNLILKSKNFQSILSPILASAKKLTEREEIKKNSHKKVKRKNKYANKVIIAGTLAAISLFFTISGVSKEMKKTYSSDVVEETAITLAEKDDFEYADGLDVYDISVQDETPPVEDLDIIEDKSDEKFVSLSYSDRTFLPKAQTARENYKPIIEKYSKMYGLDPNLILALATQERGVHSGVKDPGGATGLMQIQNSVWVNHSLKAFNFETNSQEQIVVNEERLSDLEYNIKVGCMIFQDSLRSMQYNILLALQTYNMGYGSVSKILNNYCADTGKSKESVIADQCDNGWMAYRNIIRYGDQNYVENVLSYYGDICNISVRRPDHTEVNVCVKSFENQKVY